MGEFDELPSIELSRANFTIPWTILDPLQKAVLLDEYEWKCKLDSSTTKSPSALFIKRDHRHLLQVLAEIEKTDDEISNMWGMVNSSTPPQVHDHENQNPFPSRPNYSDERNKKSQRSSVNSMTPKGSGEKKFKEIMRIVQNNEAAAKCTDPYRRNIELVV